MLSTSMMVFSSKAFNIAPLIPIVKSSLNEKTMDPFLCLVEDSKLNVASTAYDHHVKTYGSKEDDDAALQSLSAVVELTDSQSKNTLVSLIVNSLGDSPDLDQSTIRKQLLEDFVPENICLSGLQFEAHIHVQSDNKDKINYVKDLPPLISFDDDVATESSEHASDPQPEFPIDSSLLLGISQILETTWQGGRFSVSTTPGVSYKEMANHCEKLIVGKQQKMSSFMCVPDQEDVSLTGTSETTQPSSMIENQVQKGVNPFADHYFTGSQNQNPQPTGNMMTMCATEYQYEAQCIRLPASNPFDNFLRAAGC
ncbi:uncharacterized protein A4U43_C01F35400 [Asparagus officinalis]|uniref:Uncharacterized protein n=2 Tax=Asparagus officinalis TaxID=4686 RepID=A0A5P1FX44_ASPOF|nr:uncharacterized protein A4U43_C01F35400 [Asparagus officinalis]